MPYEFDASAIHQAVSTIKGLSIDAVEKANSGHPGTPMGLADIAFEIWGSYMRHDPSDPHWVGRDRFVLSAGHASMLLYSLLHLSGYDVTLDDLKAFRQWGSRTPGHPEFGHTAGVETTTGPLGQGIGNAVGMALASKMKAARFGQPYADARVWAICGDGDVMEGISGEASSFAGHHALSNLVVVYDDNRITIDGETKITFSEDVGKRYEAYGWFVQHIDGHDHVQIRAAFDKALKETSRPSFIVARTHIANGAPNAHDTSEAHGAPLGKDEIAKTKTLMGFDPEKTFFVPESVYASFKTRAASLKAERAVWESKFAAWKQANAPLAAEREAFEARVLPADLLEKLIAALPAKDDATRGLSNAVEQTVAKLIPGFVGGSADLGKSNKTVIKGAAAVGPGEYAGRNINFGIREHAMGAIVNGMVLSGGFIPFGATFLIFSDYMRGSIRLSALMHQSALWIFTHDSIFVGEDGPTHQPIEQLWSLRLVPNLYVIRPADALETAAAWTLALERTNGPSALALTRQTIPAIARDPGFTPREMLKGAYVIREASGGAPDLVIIATGSELHIAMEARTKLEADGKRVRVVSALCLERFAEQDAAYKSAVLPSGVPTVSIEAGRSQPWRAYTGLHGLAIGIDHFGASAPDKILASKFGITTDAVVERIRQWK